MLREEILEIYYGESPSSQLLYECRALARYILTSGKKVSPSILGDLTRVEMAMHRLGAEESVPEDLPQDMPACSAVLSRVHAHFCEVIAPAKPRSILLLEEQRDGRHQFFLLGPVPLIRRMMLFAVCSLLVFLGVSLTSQVDGKPDSLALNNEYPLKLLLNYIFLISAAGLGASFAALFQTNQFVKSGTFDPKYDQSYWNRLFLGIMAGLIMAFFFPIEEYTSLELRGFGRPLLAILGGFSSAAVHRILSRIVSALESMVKGDPEAGKEAALATARAAAETQNDSVRMDLAGKLSRLHAMIDKDDKQDAREALQDMEEELYSGRLGTHKGNRELTLPTPSEKETGEEQTPFSPHAHSSQVFKMKRHLASQCLAMLDYANDSGNTGSPQLTSQLELLTIICRQQNNEEWSFDEPEIISRFTEIHNRLVEAILPATPRAILNIAEPRTKKNNSLVNLLRFRGVVPLVRQMRVLVVLSMLGLVFSSLSKDVDGSQSFDFEGTKMLVNLIFLLSAASMGACFSNLFTANQYIKKGTFDNLFESTYWSRYILGLMGGIMIAMLVPMELFIQPDQGNNNAQAILSHGLGPAILALLGGFAASFVYRVLDKLVKVMESMVKIDPKVALASKEMEAQARLVARAGRERMDQARELSKLQKEVAENKDVDAVLKALEAMQQRLSRSDQNLEL